VNRQIVQALFLDALYQVLDNKVFRILAGVVLTLVLSTFLIGARDDALVLLFGWKELFYEDIFLFFDLPFPGIEGAGQLLVQHVQTIFVDFLAGTFGIIFAIAATAFFVPRMLEKGAADTLFSKPVSRCALLLSRYAAGILFVGLLAVVLVGGMHVGFLLNSGYSDPGFLWSIASLIYVFALLHGVSILVGVVTRSTVAAILITLFFMFFTSCIHAGWQVKEAFVSNPQLRSLHEEEEAEAAAESDPNATETSQADADDEDEDDERWRALLFHSLDAVHYVLPKTSDAAPIARKMRENLEYRYAELYDEQGGLLIPAPPGTDWERRTTGEDLEGEGLVWARPDGGATIKLTRRSIQGTNRLRAAKALRISLESRAEVSSVEDRNGWIGNSDSKLVTWAEAGPEGERRHRTHFFTGGGQLYTLEIEGSPAWSDDTEHNAALQRFARSFTFNESENATDPTSRFENKLAWDAPLPYNIAFSIGSSLAFLIAVLALAWWRLARIDF
jgi:ABC-type transport system involved in multi-copper enzyme maturation permease subunit